MAIEDDVLVIGGGLAGVTAALSAAEYSDRVRLLTYKQSTLRHASGLIDVLGYTPDGEGPLEDPFEAISDLPSGHPYERVGLETLREALLFFDAVAGDAYAGGHTDTNALVPTAGGTVKPTARYPSTTAAGVASDPRATLLVGFETVVGFDAPLAAAHLRAVRVPFEVRGETLTFPGNFRADAKITRYAHTLDHDERLDTGTGSRGDGGGVPARTALAETIRPVLEAGDESRLGLPAILGAENAEVVERDLEERLGVEVFEVPTGPPSLPGVRLETLLYDALEDAGVRVTTGVPVVGYEAAREGAGTGDAGQRIEYVLVDRKGQEVPYRAEEYVLATGGLVGKGVRSSRDGVFEPIFDCHVSHPESRYDWFADDAFGEHEFARFGVTVDRELRPLDGGGDLEFLNLRAAGAVLGGYDFSAEKSGSGVSLATGYAAGRSAGAEVGE